MSCRPWFLSLAMCLALSVGCSAGNEKEGATGTLGSDGGLSVDGSTIGFDANDPDAPYDPDAACTAKSFAGTKLPLTIAVVFDVSSSMSSGGRMTTAQSGLKTAFGDPKFDDVAVGLFRFGFIEGLNGCTSDTKPFFDPAPLKDARTSLFAKIDALAPSGATPTYSGLNAAYAWLAPKILAKAPPLDGKVAVILVTDGAPTCGYDPVSDYVALVKKGRAATIDTFVIGLPGSGEPIEDDPDNTHSSVLLTRIAAAGTDLANLPPGCATDPKPVSSPVTNPCYFDLQKDGLSVTTLSNALDSIRKAASSCEYALPSADAKYDLGNPGVVVVDGSGAPKTLPKCVDPASPPPEGCWAWADSAKTRVKILGAACTTVKTDDKARVDVLLQCRPK